jgi:hypothetical protein
MLETGSRRHAFEAVESTAITVLIVIS